MNVVDKVTVKIDVGSSLIPVNVVDNIGESLKGNIFTVLESYRFMMCQM